MKLFKIRASALSEIMSEPKEKSPKEKYLDATELLLKHKTDYSLMVNKETKTAAKKWDSICATEKKVIELESEKDSTFLSDTCKTHLNNWVDENIFKRKKDVKTWAMQKGTEKETEALIIVNKFLGTKLKKDSRHFENDYSTGHIDIDYKEERTVYDIKICETFSTFPRFKEKLEKNYYWQMQQYLNLMEYDKAVVIKVLVNSPIWQIKQLIKNSYFGLLSKYGETNAVMESEHMEDIKNIFSQHVFDDTIEVMTEQGETYKLTESMIIPTELRVKCFEVKRCQEDIDKIHPRVLECREFLRQNNFHN